MDKIIHNNITQPIYFEQLY